MLFDTHAHYDDERFDADRERVIADAYSSGVTNILNASSDVDSSEKSIELTRRYEFFYAAVGVHPHNAGEMSEEKLLKLKALSADPRVVAIGEIGLDYFYDFAPKEKQKYWFSRQIGLAREVRLPIIVHNRDAHEDVMNIIKSEKARETGGVFHCYTGSVEMARELLDNNFYISIGGPVTFKNARKAVEVVRFLPLDRLLLETDCPYLTPEPHRGKRNDSSYVRLVAEKIASIREMTAEEIADITTANAKRLFGIL